MHYRDSSGLGVDAYVWRVSLQRLAREACNQARAEVDCVSDCPAVEFDEPIVPQSKRLVSLDAESHLGC